MTPGGYGKNQSIDRSDITLNKPMFNVKHPANRKVTLFSTNSNYDSSIPVLRRDNTVSVLN
jgi:hypothetical protein